MLADNVVLEDDNIVIFLSYFCQCPGDIILLSIPYRMRWFMQAHPMSTEKNPLENQVEGQLGDPLLPEEQEGSMDELVARRQELERLISKYRRLELWCAVGGCLSAALTWLSVTGWIKTDGEFDKCREEKHSYVDCQADRAPLALVESLGAILGFASTVGSLFGVGFFHKELRSARLEKNEVKQMIAERKSDIETGHSPR